MVNQVQLSYALADYHYDAVGVLAIDPTGEYLLSGDYSAVVKISHLETGQTFQEIEIPNAGAVTAGIWIKLLEDGNEVEGFAIGTVHGVVEIYKRVQNVKFEYIKSCLAHPGEIQGFDFDAVHHRLASTGGGYPQVWALAIPSSLLTPIGPLDPKREKQLCRTVHFVDRGEAVLVTYLESHAVVKYRIEPWQQVDAWRTKTRIGHCVLVEGRLYISNLCDGIDRYAQGGELIQHYSQKIQKRIIQQLAITNANQWIIVGSDDGMAHIYVRHSDSPIQKLKHSDGGRVQTVTAYDGADHLTIVTASTDEKQPSVIKVWRTCVQERSSGYLHPKRWEKVLDFPAISPWIWVILLLALLLVRETPIGRWSVQYGKQGMSIIGRRLAAVGEEPTMVNMPIEPALSLTNGALSTEPSTPSSSITLVIQSSGLADPEKKSWRSWMAS